MNLRLKEGELKMSGKDKIYKGNSYEFTLGKGIGKGGNGRVFEVNISDFKCKKNYVVKILSLNKWKDKGMKELRYKRFHKEIHKVLELQNNISGIMKIIDFHCPSEMQEKSGAWYLMYKAESFNKFIIENNIDLKRKVEYLLELSNILFTLHEKGYSHRDIKIDNLLILDNQLMLSDFGLIWNIDDSRITGEDERLGPFYIGPPELENRYIDMDDFRPSDVYLFAKVVWMVLKNDNIGFRGEYKRDNKQFYLNAVEYGVTTFEPIHKLLEKSTKLNMNERINIKECRELIIEELSILDESITNKALSYRFEELKKEMINNEDPDERVYRNFNSIFKELEKFTPISNIIIEGVNEIINADLVKRWKVDDSIIFKSNLKIGQTYLCYPDYVKYISERDSFELHIKKIEREDVHSEFVSYKESRMLKWAAINTNIFLDEPLVIRFEKRDY